SRDLPTVFVVDDDRSVRNALEVLFQDAGWRVRVFSSAQAFLDYPRPQAPNCLVLDIALSDLNGLEVQSRLAADRSEPPVIFISNCADVHLSVRAMKAGASDFFMKPFGERVLVAAVQHALDRSRSTMESKAKLAALHERYDTLTKREREVMQLVTT